LCGEWWWAWLWPLPCDVGDCGAEDRELWLPMAAFGRQRDAAAVEGIRGNGQPSILAHPRDTTRDERSLTGSRGDVRASSTRSPAAVPVSAINACSAHTGILASCRPHEPIASICCLHGRQSAIRGIAHTHPPIHAGTSYSQHASLLRPPRPPPRTTCRPWARP